MATVYVEVLIFFLLARWSDIYDWIRLDDSKYFQ